MNELFDSLAPLDGETPNAYQAFCDYVDMGYARSFSKLIARYQSDTEASPTTRLPTIKQWSIKFEWQRRLKAYQQELTQHKQQERVEAFNAHMDRAIPSAATLLAKIEEMIGDFQRLRTTRRQLIDHPSDMHLPADQRRQIESITTKVNANDLQKLIQAFGTLNKDFRTANGLPDVKEIQGVGETVVKTYVTVSPDDWDTIDAPALPEPRPEIEEEDPPEDLLG